MPARCNSGLAELSANCCVLQAYAAARMAESCLLGLEGENDIYECAYVESNVTKLPFFASKVMLLSQEAGGHRLPITSAFSGSGLHAFTHAAKHCALRQGSKPLPTLLTLEPCSADVRHSPACGLAAQPKQQLHPAPGGFTETLQLACR